MKFNGLKRLADVRLCGRCTLRRICTAQLGAGRGSDADAQFGRHGVDAHLHGPRSDDGHPRIGPLLRRHGAQEERAVGADGHVRHHLPSVRHLPGSCGYSLAFTDGGEYQPYIGGLSKAMLAGVTKDSLTGTIPELVFFAFQMTFAIITPALIIGAIVDRMKFSALLIFMAAWMLLVYIPVCHWVWGGGFLAGDGVLDFAGGTVVHINAGIAGLVACLVLGRRTGYGTESMAPFNLVLHAHRRLAAVGRLVRL